MSLSIDTRQTDHVVVLEVTGRLSIVEPALRHVAWESDTSSSISGGCRISTIPVWANCAGFIQSLRNRGGEMVLLKPTPRIRTMLEITKLNTVFHSFDTEADATAFVRTFRSTVSA